MGGVPRTQKLRLCQWILLLKVIISIVYMSGVCGGQRSALQPSSVPHLAVTGSFWFLLCCTVQARWPASFLANFLSCPSISSQTC